MTETLAELRYEIKRSAAKSDFGHGNGVPRPRRTPKAPKEPKTPAHALLLRRVHEEMKARGLNTNNAKAYGIKQRTLWDVLNSSDPRLSTIYKTARAFGLETHQLLQERPAGALTATNVTQFPPITPTFDADNSPKGVARKKRRR